MPAVEFSGPTVYVQEVSPPHSAENSSRAVKVFSMKPCLQLEGIGTQGFASNSKCVFFRHPPSKSQGLLESTKSIHVCVAVT